MRERTGETCPGAASATGQNPFGESTYPRVTDSNGRWVSTGFQPIARQLKPVDGVFAYRLCKADPSRSLPSSAAKAQDDIAFSMPRQEAMARGHPVLARLSGHALPRSKLGADCGKAIEKNVQGRNSKARGVGWLA